MQLVVDYRQELISGRCIALAPIQQQRSDLVRVRRRGVLSPIGDHCSAHIRAGAMIRFELYLRYLYEG
jgi:hypothetical protein